MRAAGGHPGSNLADDASATVDDYGQGFENGRASEAFAIERGAP
jgi:hypothetical protein